jgi:hypothetical protein
MGDPVVSTTHPLLAKLNSPDVVGVVPGSLRVREDVRQINAQLQSSQQYTFDASSLSLDGALVGSRCELVVVARAKSGAGINIPASSTIVSLREEASNIVWRDITLVINGQELSHSVRADVVRHTIDRYHQSSRLSVPSMTEYRQLNNDREISSATGTIEPGIFKQDMIWDGQRFELVRPLTDLPLFAEGDSLIPGFNTIQVRAITTSEPQSLFKATVIEENANGPPYLVVEEVKLRYTSVRLEPAIAQELQALSAAGELELAGSLWTATNLQPGISMGAKSWSQGVATAFGTVPDIAYFMSFPESSFIPPANGASASKHPLQHTWSAASDVQFITGTGEEMKHFRNIDGYGGKVKILQEMKASLADQGGMVSNSGALGDVCAVDGGQFVLQLGVGATPLYMRNWAETETHSIQPMTLKIRADLNDPISNGAAQNAQPYLVSKARHRWVLSTTPGATRIIV